MSRKQTSQFNGDSAIPVLFDKVSSDEIRQQATKLGFENDRLKRVVDTQITSVDSLMQSNANLRADRDRIMRALEQAKKENRHLDAEYGDVLEKHNLLVSGYTRKIESLDAELRERNASLYASTVLVDRQKAKLLEKDIIISELTERYRLAKKQIAINSKAPKGEPLFAAVDKILMSMGGRLDAEVGRVSGFFLRVLSSLTVLRIQLPCLNGVFKKVVIAKTVLSKTDAPVQQRSEWVETLEEDSIELGSQNMGNELSTNAREEHAHQEIEAKKGLLEERKTLKGRPIKVDTSKMKMKFETIAKELKQRAERRKLENLRKRRSKLWNSNLAVTGLSEWKKDDIVDFTQVVNPS